MIKPRALYYNILKYQPDNLSVLEDHFDLIKLDDPRQDQDDILSGVEVLFAPLGFHVDAPKIERCPKLKAVVSNTTGIPHIDDAFARQRGIAVCALHDEQEFLDTITPTAEHTIGLMLAGWRRISASHTAACSGQWDRRPWGAPAMMSRLRIGIVGWGRLGQKVGAITKTMGMDVDYYDPNKSGGQENLLSLAKRSDILSLHAPAIETTRGLVTREILESLPKGAMVVNTARGELLDLDALVDLLETGHIYCAALDTLDGEYDPDFSETFESSRVARYAREHDNLILTPHIGGSTYDAWRETERYVIDKAIKTLNLSSITKESALS